MAIENRFFNYFNDVGVVAQMLCFSLRRTCNTLTMELLLIKYVKPYHLLFTLLIGLFLLIITYSCSDREQVSNSYYKLINEAELSIIDNDFITAKEIYLEAFNSKKPFATDIYNYFILSLKLEDVDNINKALKLLISEKGAEKEFFINHPSFPNLFDVISFEEFSNKYDGLRRKFESNYDYKLNLAINSYFLKDQKVRSVEDSYVNNLDTTMYYDSIFYVKFVDLCLSENGFPDEFEVGVWMNEKSKSTRSFYTPIEILITHFYGGGGRYHKERNFDLSDCLLNEISEGNFPPEIYTVFSFWKDQCFYTDPCIIPGDYNCIVINNEALFHVPKNSIKLDSLRAEIYLEPIADSNRKAQFQLDNREYIFNSKLMIGYNGLSDKTADIIKSQFNLAK